MVVTNLAGETVGVIDHEYMVIEPLAGENRLVASHESQPLAFRCAHRFSGQGVANRTLQVWRYTSEWDSMTGWVLLATFRRGSRVTDGTAGPSVWASLVASAE